MSAAPKLPPDSAAPPPNAGAPGDGPTAMTPAQVIARAHDHAEWQIVQAGSVAQAQETALAALMRDTPEKFFADPVAAVFGPATEAAPRVSFRRNMPSIEKKSALLADVGNFVATVRGSRTIWDEALLISDELYTNSAKNSWDHGQKPFVDKAVRQGDIEFFCEADAERLLVGSKDSFGLLKIETILERMYKCYHAGVADAIRRGTSGAGIGSYLMFEACISYYAAVLPGQSTVVCVALPLGLRRQAASGLPKNMHLLSATSETTQRSDK